MKITFRRISLSKSNKERLVQINSIIEEYQKAGYRLTLRQLYYQLVSRGVIPNKQAEYAKLSNILKEGRMGGIVDWNAIEDRLRRPDKPASWDTPQAIMNSVIYQYEKPRMKGQSQYVEVWVEKDALSGVLSRVTREYHIPILVNRGYSSVSAMFDAHSRFLDALKIDQKVTILYLGDYDPSGIDMIRDVNDRISEFLVNAKAIKEKFFELSEDDRLEYFSDYYYGQGLNMSEAMNYGSEDWAKVFVKDNFKITAIALNKKQIDQYKPPPNPAKMEDPRAGDFVKKHGNQSWEIDALRPEVLNGILDTAIKGLINFDMYKSVVESEEKDKERLRNLKRQLDKEDGIESSDDSDDKEDNEEGWRDDSDDNDD